MSNLPPLIRQRGGDDRSSENQVTAMEDRFDGMPFALGMEFSTRTFDIEEPLVESSALESAWVLLHGEAEITTDGIRQDVRRSSLFDEPPTAFHVSAGTKVTLRATAPRTEWAVVRTANERSFAPRLWQPSQLKPEYRGTGLVQNACLRNVRLIFDRTTRPESNLVLGEVVNYPGRWSSYPPHHHDQPEIYHYRFTAPEGYGHAELGDDVVKIRHGDSVVIPPGRDHAQVSAPGYGMYYLWTIRHLPGNPYTGFTFAPPHAWTLDPKQQGWRPVDLPPGLA
ncbi:MAG: 5-deoxy-glucuronate isomerase [Opitutaceae bacterium]|nr:5-deoxy-glucuronate isomerase [Opitutaceae bacterium]